MLNCPRGKFRRWSVCQILGRQTPETRPQIDPKSTTDIDPKSTRNCGTVSILCQFGNSRGEKICVKFVSICVNFVSISGEYFCQFSVNFWSIFPRGRKGLSLPPQRTPQSRRPSLKSLQSRKSTQNTLSAPDFAHHASGFLFEPVNPPICRRMLWALQCERASSKCSEEKKASQSNRVVLECNTCEQTSGLAPPPLFFLEAPHVDGFLGSPICLLQNISLLRPERKGQVSGNSCNAEKTKHLLLHL